MQYYADTLLRPGSQAAAAKAGADRVQLTTEISTILGRSTLSTPTDEDKTYLAQLVANKAGVPPDEAKSRVDKTYAALEKVKSDVAQAAETARRVSVISAFLLAASLLISAVAAFWAASMGVVIKTTRWSLPDFSTGFDLLRGRNPTPECSVWIRGARFRPVQWIPRHAYTCSLRTA